MRRFVLVILALCMTLFAGAQNLETVLNKTGEALRLHSRSVIPHLKTTGYLVMKDTESKIPFKLLQERPDKLRIETTIFGIKAVQTYNGKTAWQLNPAQGVEALQTDPRDMEFIAAATAIDGPFSLNKDNKYTLKYAGTDTYNNNKVEVVMWTSDEEKLKYFINDDTFLVDAIRYEYHKNGGWYTMEYRVDNYQTYAGSRFPKEITVMTNGVERVKLYVTEIGPIVNPDPEKFEKPSFQ